MTESWQMSQFSRRARRRILETTGLSVSLQCPVESQKKNIPGGTEKHLEDNAVIGHIQHSDEEKVFLVKPDFLLSWSNPPS